MAHTFRRVLTPGATLYTGNCTRETESGAPLLSCPMCGHEFRLPPMHVPDEMGRVPYAIACRSGTCGWFDWAVLDDYWSQL